MTEADLPPLPPAPPPLGTTFDQTLWNANWSYADLKLRWLAVPEYSKERESLITWRTADIERRVKLEEALNRLATALEKAAVGDVWVL